MKNNNLKRKIAEYFDDKSEGRNINFEDPILGYEQKMRQRAVIELLAPTCGELVLDVGCGNARDIIPFVRRGAIAVGVDSSSGMIREGRKAIDRLKLRSTHLILADATRLPFREDTFDKISCSEVIEHIPNYREAIVEMKRVLKEEGKITITTPNQHSLYGLVREGMPLVFGNIGKLLRTFRIIRRQKSPQAGHPYDKWKTQQEVIRAIEERGFVLCKKLGVCFIPSQLTYYLPHRLKVAIVKVSSVFENKLRHLLTASGYGIAISATKSTSRIGEK